MLKKEVYDNNASKKCQKRNTNSAFGTEEEERTEGKVFRRYLSRKRKFTKILRIVIVLTVLTFIFVASEYANISNNTTFGGIEHETNPFFSIEIENKDGDSVFGIAQINNTEYAFSIDKKSICNIYRKAATFYRNFIPGGITADK